MADPKFVAPGTGGQGLATLGGYMLQADSPCINTGMYVPNNGGRDFFGQPVNDGHPDYGAFEYLGSGVFTDGVEEARQDELARQASEVAWAKWMFPASVASNDPSQAVIQLREPLTPGIKGTLTWQNPKGGKPVVVDLSKVKDRQRLVLPLKTDKETLESTTLKVYLDNGAFTEAFEIPFREARQQRRQ